MVRMKTKKKKKKKKTKTKKQKKHHFLTFFFFDSVTVKWGKEQFELPLDTANSVATFKQTIFEKTGVPVDKQKRKCW
jgi:adenine specific DNA methylase Mod